MRFGVFLSPYHVPGRNPTRAIHRDLELIEELDRLGFDEAWVGEHHSGGYELIASPEVFIAAAAERTRHIRLGTGVASVPYHHPLILADRMMLLDHLTRGRVMLGMGPGALVTDARMMGIDYMEQRRRLEEGLEAIAHLLRSDEPLTMETDWFTLRDARLQLAPYSDPCFELAVAAVRSPTGPRLAGRFGTGLLGVSATDARGGFDYLANTWAMVEEAAAEHGQTVDRKGWRLVAPMHLAPTVEQAVEEVRYGYADWLRFAATGPFRGADDTDIEETLAKTDHATLCRQANASGFSVYGTPEMARAQIQRLWDKSGGFGALLISLNEVADPAATVRSLELFAREVMPEFQGSLARPQRAWDTYYGDRKGVGAAYRGAQDRMIALDRARKDAKR
jgi:limonene 1,2-monooxygenase